MAWRASLAIGVLLGALGCNASTSTPQKVESEPAKATAEPATAEPAEPAADDPKKPPPLTEEELALIATDPKDLTPQMRRKRAYARRKQIMQNPDSPTARALNDLAEAHKAGEIDVQKRDGVWFSLPGSKPKGGRPPAGWRPGDTPRSADAPEAKANEGTASETPASDASPPTSEAPTSKDPTPVAP